MKFSIVITTYNRLNLLKRAINSALNQSIPCEIVVVDDNSSDGTQEYVTTLKRKLSVTSEKTIVYHRNQSNLGHSQSVNAGVSLASCEWIKPLDDDDYLAPNCLAQLNQAIKLYPYAVICSSQAKQVNEAGEELTITRQVGSQPIVAIPQDDIHYGMLLEMLPFGTPAQVVFKRNIFLQTGGWDSGLDTNFDDIDSWVKIAQFGDAIFINQCLAYRTIWPGAYNHKISFQKRLETNILIKRRIYDCVSSKYQAIMPSFAAITRYLQLHWSLAAIKQGKISVASKNAIPACFCWQAWQLLINRVSKSNAYCNSLPSHSPALVKERVQMFD